MPVSNLACFFIFLSKRDDDRKVGSTVASSAQLDPQVVMPWMSKWKDFRWLVVFHIWVDSISMSRQNYRRQVFWLLSFHTEFSSYHKACGLRTIGAFIAWTWPHCSCPSFCCMIKELGSSSKIQINQKLSPYLWDRLIRFHLQLVC